MYTKFFKTKIENMQLRERIGYPWTAYIGRKVKHGMIA